MRRESQSVDDVRCEQLGGVRGLEDLLRSVVVAQVEVGQGLRTRSRMKWIYVCSYGVESRLGRLLVASLGVGVDFHNPGTLTPGMKYWSYSGLALVAAAFATTPMVREGRGDRQKVFAVDATV